MVILLLKRIVKSENVSSINSGHVENSSKILWVEVVNWQVWSISANKKKKKKKVIAIKFVLSDFSLLSIAFDYRAM